MWLEAEETWVEGTYARGHPSIHPCLSTPIHSPTQLPHPIYQPPPPPTPKHPDATVLAVTVTAVPNTDLILRKCKVAYLPPGAGPDAEPVVEEEVGPDRLRLVEPKGACACACRCDVGGAVWGAYTTAARVLMECMPSDVSIFLYTAPEPPPMDEATGLGGWQTVAVRVVDEEVRARMHACVR